VYFDTFGHQPWTVALHFAGRSQIGDIRDSQLTKDLAARVVELAQLARPEESARSYTGLRVHVTKIPRPRQFPDAYRH